MVHGNSRTAPAKLGALSLALSLSLLSGGCAQMGTAKLPSLLASQSDAQPTAPGSAAPAAKTVATSQTDLEKATAYWGDRFAKAPSDLEAALAYAQNLRAMRKKSQALAVLQQASMFHGNDRRLAGEYGRLALEMEQIEVAEKVLAIADDPARPDWRVISARGTVLAKKGQYREAIPFFERALTHAHNHPSVLNNLALAHAMVGDAEKAEGLLRQAAAAGSSPARVRQNLALVLGLQGKYSEATEVGSKDQPASVAAADAATLRQLVKLEPQQIAPAAATQVARSAPLKGTAPASNDAAAWDSKVSTAAATPSTGLRGSR